jgi:hypothetical protein
MLNSDPLAKEALQEMFRKYKNKHKQHMHYQQYVGMQLIKGAHKFHKSSASNLTFGGVRESDFAFAIALRPLYNIKNENLSENLDGTN